MKNNISLVGKILYNFEKISLGIEFSQNFFGFQRRLLKNFFEDAIIFVLKIMGIISRHEKYISPFRGVKN